LEFFGGKCLIALLWFDQGSYYWRWRDNAIDPGYPKQIREGFAGIPDNIDAAFVWGGNDKTYFIKGTLSAP
jgi:matrix metalloproteinase-14 (membrane-inserted)